MTDEEIKREAEISFNALHFIDPTHIVAFSHGYLADRRKGLKDTAACQKHALPSKDEREKHERNYGLR